MGELDLSEGITMEVPDVPSPTRAEEVRARMNAANAAKQQNTSHDIDWKRLGLMFGGGLLAHTLASSLVNNKTEEEKRRESIWERLLAAIIPIGAAGLGAWGGKYLHEKMGQATTNGVQQVKMKRVPAYVLNGQTNALHQVNGDAGASARRGLKLLSEEAGGESPDHKDLGPRMKRVYEETDAESIVPRTQAALGDAKWWRNALYGTGAVTGIGTGIAGKMWLKYIREEIAKAKSINKSEEVIDAATIADKTNETIANEYEAKVRAHEALVRAKENELEYARKNKPRTVKRLQQELNELIKQYPVRPTKANAPTGINMQRASSQLIKEPFVDAKPVMSARQKAKATTIGGAALTGGLLGAGWWQGKKAKKFRQQLEDMENGYKSLPPLKTE